MGDQAKTPVDAEIISETPIHRINPPQVQFNCGTTFQSPFFWLLIGAGLTCAAFYFLKSQR